jgi:hypothetical protein
VTAETVAPGFVAVSAGYRRQPGSGAAGVSPYLLLAGQGAAAKPTEVGQAVLAAAAAADVTVDSLAAAGGEQVAAGGGDGSPALWWAPAGGHWARAVVSMPASWSPGSLTSVVHGSAGWLAVGDAGLPAQPLPLAPPIPPAQHLPPAAPVPVIMTSASGRAWGPGAGAQPLAALGTALAQAAAGPTGYVVVGSQAGPGGRPAAAAWYSARLSTWARAAVARAGGTAAPGPAGTAGQMLGVTADRSGFAAVGSAGSAPAVWISRDGSAWRLTVLPLPAGAASAVLTRVAAVGGQVVAVGDYSPAGVGRRVAGPAPFAAISADGGRTWREAVLHAPGTPSAVTALTAAGSGFVAVGVTGVAGNQAMICWWSPNGVSWQGGQLVAGPLQGRGVQQLTALSAAGGVLTGAGYAVTQSGEHPVTWRARYR